jgi:tetratricopeptide (TPR) repeat protein
MQIIGIIIWVIGIIWIIIQGFNLRQKVKNEQAIEHTFEVHALLAVVSVIIIPVMNLSPLHLLWMLPASFILGLASMVFPLSLLRLPASLYGSLWYIGVKNPGRAYYLAGDYVKAIESYKETARLKPNSAEAHFNLGLAYDKAGYTKEAIKSYEETIRIDPKSSMTYCNLGFLYKDLGDGKKAIENFKEAIRVKPDYDKARGNLGMLYVDFGDIENAMKEYEFLKKSNEAYASDLYAAIKAKNA